MEQILELALRNWFVVVIIIVVVSSIRRMKRMASDAGRQANRMPAFGEGPSTKPVTSTIAPKPPRNASPFGSPSPFAGTSVSRNTAYTETLEDEDDEEQEDDFVTAMRGRTRLGSMSPDTSPIPSRQPLPLKQAVAWAEIIGPPRAKRPYKPR